MVLRALVVTIPVRTCVWFIYCAKRLRHQPPWRGVVKAASSVLTWKGSSMAAESFCREGCSRAPLGKKSEVFSCVGAERSTRYFVCLICKIFCWLVCILRDMAQGSALSVGAGYKSTIVRLNPFDTALTFWGVSFSESVFNIILQFQSEWQVPGMAAESPAKHEVLACSVSRGGAVLFLCVGDEQFGWYFCLVCRLYDVRFCYCVLPWVEGGSLIDSFRVLRFFLPYGQSYFAYAEHVMKWCYYSL